MTDQEPDPDAGGPSDRTRDIFHKMDVNGDGVLTKEEFVKGCMNDETLFRLLACNNDMGEEVEHWACEAPSSYIRLWLHSWWRQIDLNPISQKYKERTLILGIDRGERMGGKKLLVKFA